MKTDHIKVKVKGLELEIPNYIKYIQIEKGSVFGFFPNSSLVLYKGMLKPTYPTDSNYVLLGTIEDVSIKSIYDIHKKSEMYPEYFQTGKKIARALFTIDGTCIDSFTFSNESDEECREVLRRFSTSYGKGTL